MNQWIPKALSLNGNHTTPEIDESLLDEEVVLLLQGRNAFNDRIYSYVKLSLRNLARLRDDVVKRLDFMPSDYGTVLAAGKGDPPDDLRAEMAITHNLVEVTPPPAPKAQSYAQPALWEDD